MLRAVIYQSYGVAKAGCPDFDGPTHDRQNPVLTMTCPLTIETAIIGDLTVTSPPIGAIRIPRVRGTMRRSEVGSDEFKLPEFQIAELLAKLLGSQLAPRRQLIASGPHSVMNGRPGRALPPERHISSSEDSDFLTPA